MERSTIIWRLFALFVICLGVESSSSASDDSFKVIVHRDNPVTTVNREFLSSAFLKTSIHWARDGKAIRPIELPKGQPVRDRFTRDVLGKTSAQLRIYWIQRIFSGTALPPPEAESTAAAIAYVLANPGALAYVPAAADPGGTKVIKIE
jgi:ABC-type phosphate transport system substrate-binding protein